MIFGKRLRYAAPVVALSAVMLTSVSSPSWSGGPLKSGGKAVAHKSGGKKVPARGGAPRAQLFSTGFPAGEPTIAFTKNGDAYFPSIDVNDVNHVEVLKSTDGGKKWKVVSPTLAGQNSHPVSLDPYIYVDEGTNRIFNIDLTVACSLLSISDNGGRDWITNPIACGRPVNDHQTLFAGRAVDTPTVAYEGLVYYCWNDVATTSCSKSVDGGLSWHPTGGPVFPGVQPEAGGFCGGLAGHGVVDNKGIVYLPKESCLQPWLGISRDEGRTWENVRISKKHSAGDGILDPSVATDNAGNVYYVWTGGDRRIYLSVSKNRGKKWSKPVVVDAPGVREANIATVTVGKPGNVAIAYYGSENSPWKHSCEKNDKCDDADWAKATWNGYMTVTKNALAKSPTFYSASVNPKDDPLIRRNCGPGRCQLVFDFIDVVLAPNGTPYATFVDGCDEVCAKTEAPSNGNLGLVARLKGIKLR